MLFLALRNLRARAGRTLFTALAIALGVGMIFAAQLVAATVEETARQARLSRLAGADLEVTSGVGARLPLSVLATLEARPEVELAAPIFRAFEGRPAGEAAFTMNGSQLSGTGLTLLGVDPARLLTRYELVAGAELAAAAGRAVWLPNDWAVLSGLRVGDTVDLTTGALTQPYTVAGLIRQPSDLPIQGPPTAWLALSTLNTALEAPDMATAILLRLRPGVNTEQARQDLEAVLGTQYLVTSAEGGASVDSVFDILALALPVAGLTVLLAGAFLVFNAFAITLAERRREIGQLRTLGMTRRQVLVQLLAEAGLVGVLGAGLGLVLGWGLGRVVVEAIARLQGNAALAATPIPPLAAPLALAAGVGVTLAVTFGLAVDAARTPPLLALAGAAGRRTAARRRPWLLWLGVALLAGAGLVYAAGVRYAEAAVEPDYGLIFLPLLFVSAAVLCLLPAWLEAGLRVAGRLFTGATARLALGAVARGRTRASLTAATLVVSFMLVIALTGMTLFMSTFLITFNASMFSGQRFLVRPFPPGTSLAETASLPTLPPIPAALQAEVEALDALAEINYFANVSLPGLGLNVGTGDRYGFAMGVGLFREKRGFPLAEGSWDEVARGFAEHEPAIFLPELTARRLGKHHGDTLTVKTLEGEVDFYIAGVGGAFPIISPASAARYFNSHPFGIAFSPRPGVEAAVLEARVDALLAAHPTALGELNTESLVNVVDQLIGPIQGLFAGLTSLSGLVGALGVAVTLIASVLERQRELGTLRALGMRRGQVRQVVLVEAGMIGLVGASLGAVGGLVLAWLFALNMNTASTVMLGVASVEQPPLPWLVALAALGIGPAVAVLAAWWPADRAASVNPAEAMRAEGATGFLRPAANIGPAGFRGLLARLPLAAKLSLTSGLILAAALTVQTAVRVNAERQLIEDNLLNLLARNSNASLDFVREQFPPEVTELTPEAFATLYNETGIQQAAALRAQLHHWSTSGTDNDFQLRYFMITDLDRRVIYSEQPEWLGRVLTDTVTPAGAATVVRITDWMGERVFEGTMPLANQAGRRLGYIQAGLSAAPIDNLIWAIIRSSGWMLAVTLVAAAGLTAWFTRRALAPVARMAEASRLVAQGDLSQRVPEANWDEVGSLARSFNAMVVGLAEHQRTAEELRLARVIQQTLLPQALPDLPGWRLEALYRPARAVGGDFYDFIDLPGGRLALVIGDVTDKGTPAALVMAATRAILRAASARVTAPGQVLAEANAALQPDLPPRMFATCFYAVLDPATGQVAFANAGHDQPYLRRRTGEVVALQARGMPLGALPGMRYEEGAVTLAPGDGLLFYTDGVAEAHDPAGEMYGFPRLKTFVAGRAIGPGLISALLSDLAGFTGPGWEQEDDVTLVVLERRSAMPDPTGQAPPKELR